MNKYLFYKVEAFVKASTFISHINSEISEAMQLADILGKLNRDQMNLDINQQQILREIIKTKKWRAQN